MTNTKNNGLILKIKEDNIEAMKSGNKQKSATLRLLIADLEKEKVSFKLGNVEELANEQVQAVISRTIKKLGKEKEAYQSAGKDTAKQEEEETLLKAYLPPQLTDEQIEEEVYHVIELVERGELDIGGAKRHLGQLLKGKADMKKVMEILQNVYNQN